MKQVTVSPSLLSTEKPNVRVVRVGEDVIRVLALQKLWHALLDKFQVLALVAPAGC